ncbi:MAG: nitroreductase family protein, partial [Halobacteriota archaeon]
MQNEDLFPIIFQRKSIRKYDLNPLDEATLKEIRDQLQTLTPLHQEIKIEF